MYMQNVVLFIRIYFLSYLFCFRVPNIYIILNMHWFAGMNVPCHNYDIVLDLVAAHAKLVYAASAWYGFCTAADKDRLEAVICRAIRSGLCSIDQLSVRELIDDANDSLFSQLMNNQNHVLHQLLHVRRNTGYDLRSHHHDRLLTHKPILL